MAADNADVLAADNADVLAADTTDVLAADNKEAPVPIGIPIAFPIGWKGWDGEACQRVVTCREKQGELDTPFKQALQTQVFDNEGQ